MFVVLRILLGATTAPLLGGFIGRSLVAPLLRGDQPEFLAWAGGAAFGCIFALFLVALAVSRSGSRRRAVGDLVLLMLCVLCMADIVSQVTGAEVVGSAPAIAALYVLGSLMTVARALRPELQPHPAPRP